MLEMPEKGLVRQIHKGDPKLTRKQIINSLRRLVVRIDSPTMSLDGPGELELGPTKDKNKRGRHPARKDRAGAGIRTVSRSRTLSQPDFWHHPCVIRKYKGTDLESSLLPDGAVEFRGTSYDSCSSAAEQARASVSGQRMNTNGWVFWQFLDTDGKRTTLFDLRKRFPAMKGQSAE